MVRPMVAADKKTYELSAIRKWLARKATSPWTGLPLPHTLLKINSDIVVKLAAFRGAHLQQTGHFCDADAVCDDVGALL